MSLLQLGSIDLSGFELPSRIGFGGAQQLTVHKLIGGARVIDALGRDDASLEWAGVLTGSDAADRARVLDSLRVAGNIQTLTWDVFCYSVIISKLHMEFTNPWWIPYRISCTVQRDLAQGATTIIPAVSVSILADLASVGQLLGPSFTAQIANASTIVSSMANPLSAEVAVFNINQTVQKSILETQVGLESDDVGQVVLAAGLLAQLSCACGYLNRLATNLVEINT